MSASTIRFARWSLFRGVLEMSTSEYPLRERLTQAVTYHLHPVFPLLDDPADLPPEIALKTAALHARLTEFDSYQPTIQAMSDEEVKYVTAELIQLSGMLTAVPDEEAPAPEPEPD